MATKKPRKNAVQQLNEVITMPKALEYAKQYQCTLFPSMHAYSTGPGMYLTVGGHVHFLATHEDFKVMTQGDFIKKIQQFTGRKAPVAAW